MADNTTLNTGTGGDVIATDDIAGVKFQRVKIALGADGVNDGDVSSANALPVSLASVPSHAVTNAGTFAVQESGAALTSLQLLDDTVATTASAITSKGIAAVGTDGTNARVLKTDTSGELQVDVLTLPALAAGTNNIGDVDVLSLPATPAGTNYIGKHGISDGTNDLVVDTVHGDAESNTENHIDVASKLMGYNGTTWDRLRSDTTNGLDVDVTRVQGSVAVTDNAGSLTVDAPVGTPVNVQIGNATISAGVIDETGASAVDALAVGGGTAHDAVDSGNPIKIGGFAVSGSASPTSVAASDRVRFIANQHGIPYMIGGHPNLITREYDFGTAAQTDVNLAAALVAADERIYITRLEVLADAANTVNVSARVGFGTANVPAASATGVSGMIASHSGLAPGSGIICGNGSGIIAVGGAGEEPRITTSAATGGNTHVIISYFLIDETP